MIRGLVAALVAAAGLVVAPGTASASTCDGSTSVAVGGFQIGPFSGTWQTSRYLVAEQYVEYNTLNPVQGLNELDRLYWRHRAHCPGDHIKIIAHSEGAGITHAWVTANKYVPRTSAVLLADPKRAPGPGSGGLSGHPLNPIVGYPLAGTDADFGTVPVLQVCNRSDVVCNREDGWLGYVTTNTHRAYNGRAHDYPENVSGVWFR